MGVNIHFKNIFSLQVKHFFKSHQKGKKIGTTKVCNTTEHSPVEVYPSIRVYFRFRILDFFIHFPSMSVLKADKYWKTERSLNQDIIKKLKFRQLCKVKWDTVKCIDSFPVTRTLCYLQCSPTKCCSWAGPFNG